MGVIRRKRPETDPLEDKKISENHQGDEIRGLDFDNFSRSDDTMNITVIETDGESTVASTIGSPTSDTSFDTTEKQSQNNQTTIMPALLPGNDDEVSSHNDADFLFDD